VEESPLSEKSLTIFSCSETYLLISITTHLVGLQEANCSRMELSFHCEAGSR